VGPFEMAWHVRGEMSYWRKRDEMVAYRLAPSTLVQGSGAPLHTGALGYCFSPNTLCG
jgi:hypothetical protein